MAHGVDTGHRGRSPGRVGQVTDDEFRPTVQVRGLARMVDEDRYCADVITQISAVQEALRSVSRTLMRNHLSHCAAAAIRAGADQADAMYDELVDLMYKSAR